MKTYKLSVKSIFLAVFFAAVSLLAISVGLQILKDGDLEVLIGILFILAGLSYTDTALTIILQILKCNGNGLTISDKGIEHTFVIVNILAFMFAAPIRCIPWESITEWKKGEMIISVDTSKIEAGVLAKLLIKLTGYYFCKGNLKNSVAVEDVLVYEDKMINKI